jgi:hypothetical protein
MTTHPAWCDPAECTALPPTGLGIHRGGAHRSTVMDLGKQADIGGTWGQLTAQLQQVAVNWPTPVTLLLATGGDPISLTLDPEHGIGQLILEALS